MSKYVLFFLKIKISRFMFPKQAYNNTLLFILSLSNNFLVYTGNEIKSTNKLLNKYVNVSNGTASLSTLNTIYCIQQ